MPTRLIVIGDSIAYGAWDGQGGWVDRLKRDLHQHTLESRMKDKVQVLNTAIGGHNSSDVKARVHQEISDRHAPSWDVAFVVACGINDVREPGALSATETVANFDDILRELYQFSERVMIVGLTPLGQSRVDLKGSVYSQAAVEKRDAAIAEWARTEDLPYVHLMEPAKASSAYRASLVDGVHPSDAGHEFVYSTIKPHVLRHLGIA
jgi:lysophospholipase L1-like esterase